MQLGARRLGNILSAASLTLVCGFEEARPGLVPQWDMWRIWVLGRFGAGAAQAAEGFGHPKIVTSQPMASIKPSLRQNWLQMLLLLLSLLLPMASRSEGSEVCEGGGGGTAMR